MGVRLPLPRSHPGRPIKRWSRPLRPLPDAHAHRDFERFAAVNPRWKPMLQLYEQLCKDSGSELFGGAIIGGGLILAARPDVEMNEGVVLVYFDPSKGKFSISYRHSDVQPDQTEECSEADIWERLRLYLAYKFGVRIDKKVPRPESS